MPPRIKNIYPAGRTFEQQREITTELLRKGLEKILNCKITLKQK